MKILIFGLNYSPEPTGIAVYTTGLARMLADRGHDVTVLCSPPHYPTWRVSSGYSAREYAEDIDAGVRVIRCPLYVPETPSAAKRIVHHLSFSLSSLVPGIRLARSFAPDVVLAVAPSLIGAPIARIVAAVSGARSWLHVQDFEVEAAFATGAIASSGLVARLAYKLERLILRMFDRVSTISPQMIRKLHDKGVAPDRTYELRNWANIALVRPHLASSPYRKEWNIRTEHVALYSGSIGNKQGIEIVVEAARRLHARPDITFVICGEGPNRARLEAMTAGLDNIFIKDLQPLARLGELMQLATVHLLPQIDDAADLVLPSKLTNMLASGRPVIATASAGTGLYDEIQGCGIAVSPGNIDAFVTAIASLIDDSNRRAVMGRAARDRAEKFLSSDAIVNRFESQLRALAATTGEEN